jgi:tetratricopeptide (TPR) repeat protein
MTLRFRDDGDTSDLRPPSSTPIFHIPFDRNPDFTGRDSLLADLQEDLTDKEENKHVQAIYGLGGVGKTQTAVEYAHRFRERYAVVYWIRAEETASIWVDYANLARAIGLDLAEDAPLETVREKLRNHLARRSDYLLIFDNASAPSTLQDFIPRPCRGAVLITSRNPNWGGLARSTALHGLTRDASIHFLRKRTGRLETDTAARKLAQALGDLPLALEQAAALIQRARIPFAEYLRLFEAHWGELLAQKRPGGDYPDSVAMAWELSFRRIEAENPSAIRLMNLLAFLSPDGIPRSMLVHGIQHLPEDLSMTVADAQIFAHAVGSLAQFSLVEEHHDADAKNADDRQIITMHRLVSALARDRMTEDARRLWAGAAARIVAQEFVFDSADSSTWPRAAAMLPHALAAAHYAQATGVPIDITCNLLDQAGRYLNRFAQYDQAKVLLDRALALSRRAYGDESPKVSAIANDMGRVLARLGHRELAQQHFEWALAIDRNTYGDADPHAATVMNNYAMVLHAGGQLDAAQAHFQSALQIFEQHYGPTHPKVATLLNNLGYIHQRAGDHQSAHDLYHRALTVAERTVGGAHPMTASILRNLGRALMSLGHPHMARDHLERALTIDQASYGGFHPDVGRDCEALADLMRQLKEPALAAQYDDRAKIIRAKAAESGPASATFAAVES